MLRHGDFTLLNQVSHASVDCGPASLDFRKADDVCEEFAHGLGDPIGRFTDAIVASLALPMPALGGLVISSVPLSSVVDGFGSSFQITTLEDYIIAKRDDRSGIC